MEPEKTVVTTISMNDQGFPPEYKALYDALYQKISALVAGGHVIDIRKDPTTLRIMIESAMTIVENFQDINKQGLSGPEKKRIALTLIKCVITDLGKNGKIDPAAVQEINDNIDFWGGIAMDVAVDAIKLMFQIGQGVLVDAEAFAKDAKTVGCSQACKKDCCCGLF